MKPFPKQIFITDLGDPSVGINGTGWVLTGNNPNDSDPFLFGSLDTAEGRREFRNLLRETLRESFQVMFDSWIKVAFDDEPTDEEIE